MSITGLPGQGPVRVGIPIADLCAGLLCAHGIMVEIHPDPLSALSDGPQALTFDMFEALMHSL